MTQLWLMFVKVTEPTAGTVGWEIHGESEWQAKRKVGEEGGPRSKSASAPG